MKCLVLGHGPWGENIRKTIAKLGHSVTEGAKYEAVFVATPAHTHEFFAAKYLNAGLPVFCEKPFTTTLESAERLLRIRHSRPFLVDHTQLFNPQVTRLRALYKTPTRVMIWSQGQGPFRENCSGIWDWGAHAAAEAMWLTRCTLPVIKEVITDGPVSTEKGVAQSATVEAMFNGIPATLCIGNAASTKTHRGEMVLASGARVSYDTTGTPLTNAVSAFIGAVENPDAAKNDTRFGFALPVAVVRFLTEVDKRLAAQAVS